MSSVIPLFPDFSILNLSHKDLLQETSKRFPPYSDFNFVSLYTWNIDEAIAVATLHDNLVVRFSNYEDNDFFLSLLGTNELRSTLDILFDYCQEKELSQELKLIPHSVIEAFSEDLSAKFEVVEDRDNHDYVMSVEGILNGNVARSKRRSYKRFILDYGDRISCGTLDPNSAEVVKEVKAVISTWKNAIRISLENEKELGAIEKCLHHSSELNVECYGSVVDKSLVAFIFFEVASDSTAILHYGKSNRGLPGAFDYTKVELARHLKARNIRFMNFEQDLGIEGLRADKISFRPIEFLKKYTVRRRL